jgi:hypothetical protein
MQPELLSSDDEGGGHAREHARMRRSTLEPHAGPHAGTPRAQQHLAQRPDALQNTPMTHAQPFQCCSWFRRPTFTAGRCGLSGLKRARRCGGPRGFWFHAESNSPWPSQPLCVRESPNAARCRCIRRRGVWSNPRPAIRHCLSARWRRRGTSARHGIGSLVPAGNRAAMATAVS